jgi:ferredoxin-type protein NapF
MKRIREHSRLIILVLALLLALPVPSPFLGGLLWFSPYLFLITVLSSKTFVLLNLLGLAGLLLIAYKRRFICRYLCPLGVVCDQVSRRSPRKKKLLRLRNFHKTLALFALGFALFSLPLLVVADPFYIFQTALEPVRTGFTVAAALKLLPLLAVVTINLFFPGSWCGHLCPLGGLQGLVADLKEGATGKSQTPATEGRRLFISGLAGLSLGLLGSFFTKTKAAGQAIRPPSALSGDSYLLTCIRCGNCIGSCPTGILHPRTDPPMLSFLVPEADFSESYCLPNCKRCGEVCPSGALPPFTLQEKKSLFMATVRVDHENCLLYQQKECSQCKQYCAYGAVSYQQIEPLMPPAPVIDPEKCVGCAACKIVCPVQVIHMDFQLS